MSRVYKIAALLAFAPCIVPRLALADGLPTNDVKTRCSNDQANTKSQVIGRNAWAKRCGYILDVDENYGNARDMYATFSNLNAPWDSSAPCTPGGRFLAMCALAGCYTPDQRVMFGGSYRAIGQAAMGPRVPTITALGESWSGGDYLPWSEEPLASFVAGDEQKPVLRITAENGYSVEVTDGHPLVDADGNVVQAKTVKEGDSTLLTADGPSRVVSVSARPYSGKVWNVDPVSARPGANIHLAEGFVTGSIRFQNEWAKDESRLHLRSRIDSSAF